MGKAKLATFRIDENDWDSFQAWVKAKGTNASSELIGFVQSCIGKGDRLSMPEQLDDDIDSRIDKAVLAAIAPIIERLNKLESSVPETTAAPLLEYLESQAIAENPPGAMVSNADENETTSNHTEPSTKPVTGDLSEGIGQRQLGARLGVSGEAVRQQSKKDTFAQWSAKKDPEQIPWRRVEKDEKVTYFPVTK